MTFDLDLAQSRGFAVYGEEEIPWLRGHAVYGIEETV